MPLALRISNLSMHSESWSCFRLRLEQLLRFSRALQTPRVHNKLIYACQLFWSIVQEDILIFKPKNYRIFKILNTNLRKTYFLAVSPIKQGFKHAESILLRGFLHVRNSFVFRLWTGNLQFFKYKFDLENFLMVLPCHLFVVFG